MIVRTFAVGAFQENAYLLVDDDAQRGVLVDPGEEGGRLVRAATELGARLEAIWLTHAHVDHVGGIAEVKRIADVPIHLHALERPLYDRATELGLRFGLEIEPLPPPERTLAEGDGVTCGSLRFTVMHVPGHAPGHVVFHGHGIAFVGDCLFAGSIGRTDLPMANAAHLARSLERIAALPGDTVVYPGHGPATTVDQERKTNPFLNGTMRIGRR